MRPRSRIVLRFDQLSVRSTPTTPHLMLSTTSTVSISRSPRPKVRVRRLNGRHRDEHRPRNSPAGAVGMFVSNIAISQTEGVPDSSRTVLISPTIAELSRLSSSYCLDHKCRAALGNSADVNLLLDFDRGYLVRAGLVSSQPCIRVS
jgi:hypothetical protein